MKIEKHINTKNSYRSHIA